MTDATPSPDAPAASTPGVPTPPPGQLLKHSLIALIVAAVLLVTVVLPAEHGVDPTGVGRLLGLTEMGAIKTSLAEEAAADARAHAEPADAPAPAPATALTPGPAPASATASADAGTSASAATAPGATPGAEGSGAAAAGSSAATEPAATAPASSGPATEPATRSDVSELVLAPGAGKEIKLVMRKGAQVTYSWSTDRGVVNFDAHADGPGIGYHGYGKGFGKASGEGVLVAAFDGSHGWFWRNRGKETVTVTLRTDGEYQELKRP